jgi:hypothetical protein
VVSAVRGHTPTRRHPAPAPRDHDALHALRQIRGSDFEVVDTGKLRNAKQGHDHRPLDEAGVSIDSLWSGRRQLAE